MGEASSEQHVALDEVDYASLIRLRKPLVQCITNYVSMDIMANVLNAVGASPAMVHAEEEVEEFMELADCLVINVGTLTSAWLKSMHLAVHKANALGKPWVLDPAGAGATKFRTNAVQGLLHLKPTLVRGNASEIKALVDPAERSRGVDSVLESGEAVKAAEALAKKHNTIVAVTGYKDYVTNGGQTFQVGCMLTQCEEMTQVTAIGCSLTAVMAAYLVSVEQGKKGQALAAAVQALCRYKDVSGALGYVRKIPMMWGPGTFRVCFIDSLADEERWADAQRYGWIEYFEVKRVYD